MSLNTVRFAWEALPRFIMVVAVAFGPCLLGAAPIPVRFPEGSIHGFLILRTQDGKFLAQGDLLEIARGAEVHKTTVFRFKDGSLFEETAVFSQEGVYKLLSYRLDQHGPAFAEDVLLSMERATGKYRVEIQARGGGPAKILEGTLDLPADAYNGMIPTVLKDLPKGTGGTIHFVAFSPEPKVIELEMAPSGEHTMMIGELEVKANHYVLKARLGAWLTFLSKVLGRVPPDANVWVIDGDVPAFVGFEGQLFPTDPVWRIDLVSPTRP